MNIIGLYLGGALVGGAIAGVLAAIGENKDNRQSSAEQTGNQPGGGYLLEGYQAPEREEGEGLLRVMLSALRSLDKQRAAGFRCWIPACVERLQMGLYVPERVALQALYMTRDELAGSRFDLGGVNAAIVTLENNLGEWD